MNKIHQIRHCFRDWYSLPVLVLLLAPAPTQAKYFGADPPLYYCSSCDTTVTAGLSNCSNNELCYSGTCFSRTEGNQRETYFGVSLKSASGAPPPFSLTYNSYNADTSRARIDTVLGNGWTHSYNIFLYSVRGHMFRVDGGGRITKYRLGAGGTFTAATGYFETLVKNPDGSFTLTQKDKTSYRFAAIAGTPFMPGTPVYQLTSITDRNNNTVSFTYSLGLLSKITDTYGRSLTFSYNTQKKLDSVTDPLGRTTTFTYDPSGTQLQQITDPAGKSVQYDYNTLFQITRKRDKDGRVFNYGYLNNKPTSFTDGGGSPYFGLSNPGNWATDDNLLARDMVRQYVPGTTSKTDGRGNVWQYQYDANGYVVKSIAPDGATWTYTYDPATLMPATETDANGHTTRYRYDAQGNLLERTDHLGFVTTYTYEPIFNQMTSMTDASGRTTRYTYDERGNRIKEIDPLSGTRSWSYDAHGNVLTDTDKNEHTTSYAYDDFGNRIQSTDALGNVTRMTYDPVGNMTSRTDTNSHTMSYAYDGLDRVIKITDPLGKLTQINYDGQGNQTLVIDRTSNATQNQYDQRSRLTQITDALTKTKKLTYDANNNRSSATDKNNHTTNFGYDVQNRLIKTVDALGNTARMTYDGVGNKLTETDANAHTTTYTYDALNRVATRTDAVGNVTTMVYDSVGPCPPDCAGPTKGSSLVTKQTDGNGKVTYFKYDGLDRLIKQVRKQADTADAIDADDAVTSIRYDAMGNRLSMTEPNGNTMTYAYDPLNRKIKETNAAGDVTMTGYDGVGNIVSVTAPTTNVTHTTYDALDRPIQVQDGGGIVNTTTYDAVGNVLTRTDGNNSTTSTAYDSIYRVTQATDALGNATSYAYDPVGNLVSMTDRNGNPTSYVYNAIDQRVSMTNALGDTTQYQYDPVGNLSRITDANGNATSYAYDGVNRQIRETYADGRSQTYTYDFVGNLTTRTDPTGRTTNYSYNDLYFLLKRTYPVSPADNMTYDLSGRMLSAERGGWLVTFIYDGANRVTQTTQNGKTIHYVYDIPGRTRTLTYPGGRTITERMDIRSRLSRIDDADPNLAQYSYDAGNRVLSRVYRNGVTASYTYNANDWLTSLEHSVGSTRIAGFGYDYDAEGNKRFEEKRADSAASQTQSEAYQYDNIYRLIDYKMGTLSGSTVPLPTTQTQYTLDPVGNWNVKTKNAIAETRTHNAVNEITAIDGAPLAYDNNGNLNINGGPISPYDEENRLVQVGFFPLGAVYQYDALGRRVRKIFPGFEGRSTISNYYYDGARIVEEQNSAGATQATYVYGNYVDEVLNMARGGVSYYYHQNALWSVEAITDSAANVVERYSYDAYGLPAMTDGAGVSLPRSAIGNPWMLTGRQLDEETGLYFYRARYYDSVKGRFLQRDPQGYEDGMNLYEYVKTQPTNLTDPTGELARPCTSQYPCAEAVAGPSPPPPPKPLSNSDWMKTSQAQLGKKKVVLELHFTSSDTGANFWLVARAEDKKLFRWRGISVNNIYAVIGSWQYACENYQGNRVFFPPEFIAKYAPYDLSARWVVDNGVTLHPTLNPTGLAHCLVGSKIGHWVIVYASFSADRYGGPHGIKTYTNYP